MSEGRKALACFWRRALHVLIAIVVVAVLSASAGASDKEGCQIYDAGENWIEWFDAGELRGARLVVLDKRWTMDRLHIGNSLSCESCNQDAIAGALVLLWRAPFFGPVDAALVEQHLVNAGINREDGGLDTTVISLTVRAMNHSEPEVRAVTNPADAALSGMRGRARVVAAKGSVGPHHAIAFVGEEKCISLFGIFPAREGKEISVVDLQAMSSVIGIERYAAVPRPQPRPLASPSLTKFPDTKDGVWSIQQGEQSK